MEEKAKQSWDTVRTELFSEYTLSVLTGVLGEMWILRSANFV